MGERSFAFDLTGRDGAKIIDLAFAAASGDRGWDAVTSRLAVVLGVDVAAIVYDGDSGKQETHLLSIEPIESGLSKPRGEISSSLQSSSRGFDANQWDGERVPCRRVLKDHRFFQSWTNSYGVESLATVHTEYLNGYRTRCRLSVIRGGKRVKFARRDREAIREFLPRFEHAFTLSVLRSSVETMHSSWNRLVEGLECGVVLLSHGGMVLEKNSIAAAIIERRDGIYCLGRRLFVRRMDALIDVGSLVLNQRAVVPCSFSVQRAPGIGAYQVNCKALAARTPAVAEGEPVALVLIGDSDAGDHGAPEIGPLASSCHMTPREVVVLRMLVEQDMSPCGIAESLGVSIRTVRTQLSSIYGKTGTSGQKELLMLFLRGKV